MPGVTAEDVGQSGGPVTARGTDELLWPRPEIKSISAKPGGGGGGEEVGLLQSLQLCEDPAGSCGFPSSAGFLLVVSG